MSVGRRLFPSPFVLLGGIVWCLASLGEIGQTRQADTEMGDARLIRKYVCSRRQIPSPMFDALSVEDPFVYDLWPGIGNAGFLESFCVVMEILDV